MLPLAFLFVVATQAAEKETLVLLFEHIPSPDLVSEHQEMILVLATNQFNGRPRGGVAVVVPSANPRPKKRKGPNEKREESESSKPKQYHKAAAPQGQLG